MQYTVLARKYRPANFDQLIGQEALVRTLSNAIKMDRIAHAFLLTGIRGVGKTTTARIIARALNCVGADGKGGPTINPCGVCEHCTAIAADRHVDVIEMDAASRTGVGDVREIIETVQYKPSIARTKVYIIDEVHMLSNSAFNALLKTLEEPPPHVKFIFATTEIRKIPVTVLSRCQRFDLRRIDAAALIEHLAAICGKENIKIEPEALAMIARAAEGSVRDALSLLDQAIAHTSGDVSAESVKNMLGLADRGRVFNLLEAILGGQVEPALKIARSAYHEGNDPSLLLQDMMDALHFITQVKIIPALGDDNSHPEAERVAAKKLAAKLSVPVLTRSWQTMLKGAQELRFAAHPMQALEMVLVRLGYMSELPPPEKIIRDFNSNPQISPESQPSIQDNSQSGFAFAAAPLAASRAFSGGAAVALKIEPEVESQTQLKPQPENFIQLVALFEENMEPILHQMLRKKVALVKFQLGSITLKPISALPPEFSNRVSHCLRVWTGQPWLVALDENEVEAALTLDEQKQKEWKDECALYAAHPEIANVLEIFPGAEIISINKK